MKKLCWIVLLAGIVFAGWTDVSLAASRSQSYREAIRSMPLLERPNRPGHFYGNTVRRVYHRRHGWLPSQTGTSVSSMLTAPAPEPTQAR